MDYQLCAKCKGKGLCGKPCEILAKFSFPVSTKLHFSGSSPPEIFVGRNNYPFVNTGILSPEEYGETTKYSLPELWHENNFSIANILRARGKLIYSRFKTDVSEKKENRFLTLIKETALAIKPVSVEIFLKKAPSKDFSLDTRLPIIGNPAPLRSARIEENIKTTKKIEYITEDTDIKASLALKELYNSHTEISNIIKILSSGLLGKKSLRKLVPTRWSVTAVDSTLSRDLMNLIRNFPLVNEFQVYSSEYLGNHYEILLIPRFWSYEVLEAKSPGSIWNISGSEIYLMQDYEGFYDRKTYAENVAGGYYSPRLAVAEYLTKVKRQASVLVLREVKPTYTAPCGVGILRETTREAFKHPSRNFPSLKEALADMQSRFTLPITIFTEKSQLLKELSQKTLTNFT